MLNRSGEIGNLCLDLRGKASNLSPLSMMLAMDLSYDLHYVEMCSFYG